MNILMPQLRETVAEGKITKWFKSAGDAVKPGDNLFEIETDKVSMEVPATEAGILSEIRVAEGEVAPVGAIVAVVGDATGAVASSSAKSAPAAAEAPKAPAPPAAPQASASPARSPQQPIQLDPFLEVRTPERNFGPARLSGGVSVTPLARRLASDAKIDLSRLKGSGHHGRIVARYVESVPRPHPAPSQAAQINAAAPKDRDGKPLFKLSLNDCSATHSGGKRGLGGRPHFALQTFRRRRRRGAGRRIDRADYPSGRNKDATSDRRLDLYNLPSPCRRMSCPT
jgi:pyruvate/2-oxoglutarate dehydrogenase complex dihydrolipoamide acyltransferase (E2) component